MKSLNTFYDCIDKIKESIISNSKSIFKVSELLRAQQPDLMTLQLSYKQSFQHVSHLCSKLEQGQVKIRTELDLLHTKVN